MKKSTIVIIALIVVLVGSWVGAFLWVRSERVASLDRLNRLDYSLLPDSRLSEYLRADVGLSLDELRKTSPVDAKLRSFPELYLVARVLADNGETDNALAYYKEAEKYLTAYTGKDDITPDFYLAYMGATPYGEERTAIGERASKLIEAIPSLSKDQKSYYDGMVRVYSTGELNTEEGE